MKVSPGSMALTWPGLASLLALSSSHREWEWSEIITEPGRGPQIRYHTLLNREIEKSCLAFCLFKWRSSINKQPLFVPLPLSLSLLYLELLFCGLLWYWQHCMLVVTVCLQGSIKTKWVCTNEVPANQSKWSESESKESFFLLRSTQAWEPLQEHQNRCIIVSCIQALHQLHNSKHI